jgi:hypothetical protein
MEYAQATANSIASLCYNSHSMSDTITAFATQRRYSTDPTLGSDYTTQIAQLRMTALDLLIKTYIGVSSARHIQHYPARRLMTSTMVVMVPCCPDTWQDTLVHTNFLFQCLSSLSNLIVPSTFTKTMPS